MLAWCPLHDEQFEFFFQQHKLLTPKKWKLFQILWVKLVGFIAL